jgi:hypothetical protein
MVRFPSELCSCSVEDGTPGRLHTAGLLSYNDNSGTCRSSAGQDSCTLAFNRASTDSEVFEVWGMHSSASAPLGLPELLHQVHDVCDAVRTRFEKQHSTAGFLRAAIREVVREHNEPQCDNRRDTSSAFKNLVARVRYATGDLEHPWGGHTDVGLHTNCARPHTVTPLVEGMLRLLAGQVCNHGPCSVPGRLAHDVRVPTASA